MKQKLNPEKISQLKASRTQDIRWSVASFVLPFMVAAGHYLIHTENYQNPVQEFTNECRQKIINSFLSSQFGTDKQYSIQQIDKKNGDVVYKDTAGQEIKVSGLAIDNCAKAKYNIKNGLIGKEIIGEYSFVKKQFEQAWITPDVDRVLPIFMGLAGGAFVVSGLFALTALSAHRKLQDQPKSYLT